MEFRDVTFAYPARPGRLVLKGFNLAIAPGAARAVADDNAARVVAVVEVYSYYIPTTLPGGS